MRAVVDTNVIVSSQINDSGIPAQIVNLWGRGSFELVVSPALIAEYRRALTYSHVRRLHGFSDRELNESLAVFDEADVFVDPDVIDPTVASDPDDDVVIATAVAGNADYIVSGDRHLLEMREHQGIRIVQPATFLVVLRGGL